MARISIDGLHLNVVSQGQGVPLLLVHGFPLDHSMWSAQMEDFARDHHVIAPDLRGFGASDVAGEVVTMQEFADDLARLLDALNVTSPVVLCGLSMGGYVAWQFWRHYQPRVRSLILCDTRAGADTPEAANARLETAQRTWNEGTAFLADTMLPRLFSSATVARDDACIHRTREVILRTSPQGAAAALRGMAARPDSSELLSRIDVPALAVCGEHDVISPPEEMRVIAHRLPRAEFGEVPAAGHMSPLENPAAVNQAIRRFLEATAEHPTTWPRRPTTPACGTAR